VIHHAARLDTDETMIIRQSGVSKTILSSNPKFADWLAREHGINVPMKASPTAKNPGNQSLALAKDDLEFIQLQQEYPDLKPVWEARIAANSSGDRARCDKLLDAARPSDINPDGCLPVPLKYYGSHTGRFSGDQKLNLQNLTRGGELRKSILAPPGYQIVVVDLSNIESRVLAWLASCGPMLEAYASGEDLYCQMASTIYERPIIKADTLERFLGKVCILGLSYGMGHVKFKDTLAKGALGGPPIHVSDTEARRIVRDLYRKKYREIPALWREADKVIGKMSRPADEFQRAGDAGAEWWCGCRIERHGLRLPNGLRLGYPGLHYVEENDGDSGHWEYWGGRFWVTIYGAKIIENLTQALARLAMTDPMMAIDKWLIDTYGGDSRIVHTVHDELLALAPTAHAQTVLDTMIERMCETPHWADERLVLDAEGGFSDEYSK
jgi:DNA polymerase